MVFRSIRMYKVKKLLILIAVVGAITACHRTDQNSGWTSVIEADINRVSVLSGGKIMQLNVKEGDLVSKGDTLALLDSREIHYSLEQLQATLAELQAQEALIETQISLAEKDLGYQNRREDRSERLFEASVIPLQNLEDSQLIKGKAELQLKAARQNLGLVEAKKAALEAQKKTLNKKLGDCVVTSPFSGTLETLFYNAGETIPPLGQLAEISNLEAPETSIYVSEEWLAKLKPGMAMKLKMAGSVKPILATIIRISNKAEFTPKTVLTPDNRSVMVYAVRLRAANPEGVLKDGMPVDISLP